MIKAVTAIALQMPVALKQGGRGQAQYEEDESPAIGRV
jgi:hypothetical protein